MPGVWSDCLDGTVETEVQGVEHGADVGREELDFGREGIIDPSHDSKKRGSHMPWRE